MFKLANYFLQSLIIFFFFLVSKILGLKISRVFFSYLFLLVGPIFKSKKIINNNLNIFSKINPAIDRNKITREMWRNYGKTFIEYVFLDCL